METTGWTSGTGAEARFRVTLATENATASRRAQALYDRLARRLSTHIEFSQRAWEFQQLESASLRKTAAREAARSDMIVMALRGNQPLPESVRSWLETLPVLKRSHSVALVVLLEIPVVGTRLPRLREYLQSLAARCRMDLFIHSARASDPIVGATQVGPPTVCRSVVPGHAANDRPEPRWGINE
jgi:hypothetical protein